MSAPCWPEAVDNAEAAETRTEWWAGVFGPFLHRVEPHDRARLRHLGHTFGVSVCGAVCTPDTGAAVMRGRCPRCVPTRGSG